MNLQFLNRAQTSRWLRKRLPSNADVSAKNLLPALEDCGYSVITISFPKDSGRKVALARTLCSCFPADGDLLVYLENWEVWPSSGHLPLLQRFRQGLGCTDDIDTLPSICCGRDCQDDAMSMMIMALQFYWDCFFMSADGSLAVFVSHDEYVDVFVRETGWIEASLRGWNDAVTR